ncbi:PepSY domain-containing protein [Microbacterium trichothecenolyticum]|uniref:Membrane protein YkoI n=1 Tax=Microbacterium trichothecenolyticum TaxID=69370 RepID=A0ABU0TU90_MICTR|nr:PepSY domain-containing protein [Microbacterium trichothecenolyticum]MDQ1123223.1 putative membrane protein YkoI [Microbacterium trichothecenolyticum]
MASTRPLGIFLLAVVSTLTVSACTPFPATSDTATDETAVTAVNTAEASAGGRGFHLDREDDVSWEVQVAVGDREVEVTVAADGTTVRSSRDGDGIDDDERAALDAAATTLADAVRIAAAQNPGGERIDEAHLDEQSGAWAWEVEMQSGASVRLSATDGAVLGGRR